MDSESDPDAFIVLHSNPDGRAVYGIGPFPPDEDLADRLVRVGRCGCRREVVWIRFPEGVRLLIGIDVDELLGEAAEAVEQAGKDRLN